MAGPQTYGSEPVSQPPPPAQMQAPMAYPPPRKMDVSKPSLVIAVIALALALIGMVAFPGPEGPEGPEGAQGAEGPEGPEGDEGPQGSQGPQGPAGMNGTDGTNGTDGADGIACWDLNGNGIGDLATEDINGDSVVDVLDCTGPQGPPGAGTLMSFSSWISVGNIGTGALNCVDVPFLNATITAPSDGFVVVWAHVNGYLDHTFGTEDLWVFSIETSPTDCVNLEGFSIDTIPGDIPTDSNVQRSSSLQAIFPITSGQTVTYYVNGYMDQGWDIGDVFGRGSIIAVFYPS